MMKKQTSSKSYVMKFLAISIIMCILLLAGCNSKVSEENAKSNVVANDETIHSLIGMVYGDPEIEAEEAESQDTDSDLRRLVVEDRSGKLSDLTINKKKVAPDEFENVKVRLKTKDGKEYEVGSKSDNWKDYQKGQNIKVRFELKDGEPVNICWVEGVK